MRKLFVLLSFLMVASMLLSACGAPTAAPATAAPATAAPATAAPATAAPATEAPTAAAPQNPYLGSGKLDGNGIPPEFFLDVHVRKAFAYAFDWDTYVNDVYKGEAIQSFQLVLPGMPGFFADTPHYTFDLAKSAEEFKASTLTSADGKSLWDTGFRIQMLYNQGNTTRQIIAEILAANLAQVNPKFVVEILGLPWPAYLTAQRARQIPIMTGGWLEDIHDPHNWYQPYTTGAYGSRQGMPADMKAQFKALLDQGAALVDPAARAEVYKGFNQLYYDLVPGVPVVLVTSHNFQQKWVQGRLFNPIFSDIYYYPISKAAGAKNPTTFTEATFGDADTLDPALSYDTASGNIIQNVYETLIFYDGEKPAEFKPLLAESMPTISADGMTFTFKIRSGVKFQNGDPLTPSDVAYSFQRGVLQGGTVSPQWLLAAAFLGSAVDDIALVVDDTGALYDDRAAMQKADPAKLKAACEQMKAAVVADDAAGTVTMKLAQPWGPFLPTIANGWGSIMDQKWVVAGGGWDGSCDTWQNFYAPTSADNPFSKIMNGTGPFKLDHWTAGQEIVLTRNDTYWGEPAKLERVVIQNIAEWGTRFAELQAGDADVVTVPVENRSQADALVGEFSVFDTATSTYGPVQQVCKYDSSKLAVAKFTACAAGEKGTGGPLSLHIGQPGLTMDVILYNLDVH
jgi:ABC-type transport system substrate-binding protein